MAASTACTSSLCAVPISPAGSSVTTSTTSPLPCSSTARAARAWVDEAAEWLPLMATRDIGP